MATRSAAHMIRHGDKSSSVRMILDIYLLGFVLTLSIKSSTVHDRIIACRQHTQVAAHLTPHVSQPAQQHAQHGIA